MLSKTHFWPDKKGVLGCKGSVGYEKAMTVVGANVEGRRAGIPTPERSWCSVHRG
jgi:hypothetical protein